MTGTRYDAVMVKWTDFDLGDDKDRYKEREIDRRTCRTRLGADFCRRFRLQPGFTMGFSSGNFTKVTLRGDADHLDLPEWYERVWAPLYWLRDRWDGLRYGLDRDRR